MSRLRFNKVSTPPNPAANKVELYYDSSPPGYTGATPKVCARDENGVVTVFGGMTTLDYRLIKITILTAASGTWTPTVGTRAAYVELVGGGGQGGGSATSSSQASVGGG